MTIFGRTAQRNGDVIFAVRRNGNNPTSAQGTAQRFAVIAFVQPQAFGFPFALTDANAINRLQQFDQIIAVSRTERKVKGMAMSLNDQMAFQPVNSMFSRVANGFF